MSVLDVDDVTEELTRLFEQHLPLVETGGTAGMKRFRRRKGAVFLLHFHRLLFPAVN